MNKNLAFRLLICACCLAPCLASAREKKNSGPVGWGYASKGPIDIKPTLMTRPAPVLHLGRGALVAILDSKIGSTTRVRAVDPSKLTSVTGVVDSSKIERLPLDRFPADQDLMKMLGGAYWDDFTSSNAQVARYLVQHGKQKASLVCFIGAGILSQARLQVFQPSPEHFAPGPYIEFPISELKMAITSIAVEDLLGDGNECLITHEPFVVQTDNEGVNLVIRRVDPQMFVTLWKAPIEFKNTASFPPQLIKLEPPEENIGAPGTVATGTVEYRPRGAIREPVWKGKVSFFVVGREDSLDSVPVEKLCPWDGSKFAPLNIRQ